MPPQGEVKIELNPSKELVKLIKAFDRKLDKTSDLAFESPTKAKLPARKARRTSPKAAAENIEYLADQTASLYRIVQGNVRALRKVGEALAVISAAQRGAVQTPQQKAASQSAAATQQSGKQQRHQTTLLQKILQAWAGVGGPAGGGGGGGRGAGGGGSPLNPVTAITSTLSSIVNLVPDAIHALAGAVPKISAVIDDVYKAKVALANVRGVISGKEEETGLARLTQLMKRADVWSTFGGYEAITEGPPVPKRDPSLVGRGKFAGAKGQDAPYDFVRSGGLGVFLRRGTRPGVTDKRIAEIRGREGRAENFQEANPALLAAQLAALNDAKKAAQEWFKARGVTESIEDIISPRAAEELHKALLRWFEARYSHGDGGG